MTETELNNYIEKCKMELNVKQLKLNTDYKIGTFDNWKYDQDTQKLYFINNGKIILECDVVIIASWIEEKSDWLWGWANKSLDNKIIKKSEKLKEIGIQTKYLGINSEHLEADENIATELSSMAIKQLDAMGLYIGPAGKSKVFFAIMNITEKSS